MATPDPELLGHSTPLSPSAAADLSPGDSRYPESRSRVYSVMVRVEHAVAALFLGVLLVLVIAQVFTRYVLGSPLTWSEELARFVFIWFTFSAAAVVAARRKHITVLLYNGRGTGRLVSVVEGFATALVVVVSVAMTIGAVSLMSSASRLISPGTGIPLSVVYAAAAVGFGLIALHSVLNLYLALRFPRQFLGTVDIEKVGV